MRDLAFCREVYETKTVEELDKHAWDKHQIELPIPVGTADWMPSYTHLRTWLSLMEERCTGTTAAYKLSEVSGQYAFFTTEILEKLADRLRTYDDGRPILECFAGVGLLSHWLAKYGLNIIAVDNDITAGNGWTKRPALPHVLPMEAMAAVRLFRPTTVIASWVPYADKIAEHIFKDSSVKNLLWIGEGEGGCCGREAIWKNPYEDWRDVYRHSICRTDTVGYGDGPGYRFTSFHQVIGMFTKPNYKTLKSVDLHHRVSHATKIISLLAPRTESRRIRKARHTQHSGGFQCLYCHKVRNSLRSMQRHYQKKHSVTRMRKIIREFKKATEEWRKTNGTASHALSAGQTSAG